MMGFCLSCGLKTNNPCEPNSSDTHHIATSTGDRTFLWWLSTRLVSVYKEDPNTDFVCCLKRFASEYIPPMEPERPPTDCDWADLEEAFQDAVCDGEGHITWKYLKHHMEKRGIKLVKTR